jgi:hypothetical protein
MANENETVKTKSPWTPEQLIQVFKELVTAVLGIFVVLYTLSLAWNTFEFAGQTDKMTDAKDVLLLMLGLAGVVVGYYFGRVPADASAAKAQDQANAATAQTEQVTAQAQVMADEVEQVMDKISPTGVASRGISAQPLDPVIAAELQKIRDELRSMASISRRRR